MRVSLTGILCHSKININIDYFQAFLRHIIEFKPKVRRRKSNKKQKMA